MCNIISIINVKKFDIADRKSKSKPLKTEIILQKIRMYTIL
jgi:hypothetical protein